LRNPFKKQNIEVRQHSLIPMGETSKKGNYISNVIKNRFYDYYNIEHRKAVCQLDGIGKRLTYETADLFTSKTFKFYDSHEVDAVEVMQEQRARWVELNCKEIFKKCITPMIRDGYVLLELNKEKDSIDWNAYGEYECSPQLWTRGLKNKILQYKVQYTPKPRAIGSSASLINLAFFNRGIDNFRMINEEFSPKDIIHMEYGETNDGVGMPLIEGAWDSIIKLCGESHQEMLDRRTIPTLHLMEEDYEEGDAKAKGMLKMVANSDQDTARVWYHKEKKDRSGYEELPTFAHQSPTTNQSYSQRNQAQGVSTGDYGNVNKEWTRLTTVTGHTINWFMGNRAGATVGSETDKLADDEQETIDFAKVEIIIRKILAWLDSQGLITMPKEPFVIKYWKDWERIEKAAKLKAEMALLKTTDTEETDKDIEIDSQDNEPKKENLRDFFTTKIEKENAYKKNTAITKEILNCLRNNISYAMTDVMSSWIDEIGYDDETDLLYGIFSGVSYSKPAPMGEWSFIDWEAAGSKGRYFWDYLSQRDPPWQRASIPQKLLARFILEQNNSEIVKIPILDYKLIDSLDTEGKIKKLAKESGWSMGTTTATNTKKMLNSLKAKANKHQLRFNTLTVEAFGNSIKENYPLLYDIGDGIIVEEYICKDSWKKNVGKTVPLGVYHNLEQDNIPELPDWQIVGTAEIFGWDDLDGEDYVKFDYDYSKIDSVFEKINEYDWLTSTLKENGTNDISTAYYCDIEYKWNESLQKIIRIQVNIELISISFVPKGNCPGEVCSIKVIKKNSNEMQVYIKKCIAEGIDKEQCLAKAYKKFKS